MSSELRDARDAVAAPDRSADDKAVDPGRHPVETLEFFGIAPGMRVAEIIAGFGYTTELLVRTVGPSGKVYAQNNRFIFDNYGEQDWIDRLAKPVNKNVVRVDRELEDPLPSDANELDVVLDVLFYHDTFWLKTDRGQRGARGPLTLSSAYTRRPHTAPPSARLGFDEELALAGRALRRIVASQQKDFWIFGRKNRLRC